MRKSEAEGIALVVQGFVVGSAALIAGVALQESWMRNMMFGLGGFVTGVSVVTLLIVRQRKWWNDQFGRDLWRKE